MFFQKNKEKGVRLSGANLNEYLAETYSKQGQLKTKSRNMISKFNPILQQEYGGANDCSLCSIVATKAYLEGYGRSFDNLYKAVVRVANQYFYDPNKFGTIPIFINNIIDETFGVVSKKKYLKGVGFSWKTIKDNINIGNPMILSVNNDGRNYYINHSVVVVGFIEYECGARIICVYDNWTKSISYIDYNKLSVISCLNMF